MNYSGSDALAYADPEASQEAADFAANLSKHSKYFPDFPLIQFAFVREKISFKKLLEKTPKEGDESDSDMAAEDEETGYDGYERLILRQTGVEVYHTPSSKKHPLRKRRTEDERKHDLDSHLHRRLMRVDTRPVEFRGTESMWGGMGRGVSVSVGGVGTARKSGNLADAGPTSKPDDETIIRLGPDSRRLLSTYRDVCCVSPDFQSEACLVKLWLENHESEHCQEAILEALARDFHLSSRFVSTLLQCSPSPMRPSILFHLMGSLSGGGPSAKVLLLLNLPFASEQLKVRLLGTQLLNRFMPENPSGRYEIGCSFSSFGVMSAHAPGSEKRSCTTLSISPSSASADEAEEGDEA